MRSAWAVAPQLELPDFLTAQHVMIVSCVAIFGVGETCIQSFKGYPKVLWIEPAARGWGVPKNFSLPYKNQLFIRSYIGVHCVVNLAKIEKLAKNKSHQKFIPLLSIR